MVLKVNSNDDESWVSCYDNNDHDGNSTYFMTPLWVNIIVVINICLHNTLTVFHVDFFREAYDSS